MTFSVLLLHNVWQEKFAPDQIARSEKVQTVVGQVLSEIAVGIAECRVDIDPCRTVAFCYFGKSGIDVADNLFLAEDSLVSSERIVDGQK